MKIPEDPTTDKPLTDELRPHVYDGIEEYDNRLPNWWLWTLYLAIIFAGCYWFYHFMSNMGRSDEERIEARMAEIGEARLAASADLSNATLWEMSENPGFVEAGRAIYMGEGTCATCHGPNLEGGVGLNLADHEWKWGNNPMSIYRVVADGSPDKTSGMIAWESRLGAQKIKQVVAYILSHHDPAEMATAESLNTPIERN